ncbi:MAG TPA: glycogen synthase GlgA [Methylophilaceae bacterium]|nr:glycogen synthase GlgA [Methylophilaceae bacterium]HAJ70727.1 glycogen synthase GlgA [Methylophilaceae bacterium]
MRVLFVTSEAYPLIKTGGLADVSGALPNALKQLDVDIKLLIPGYPAVLSQVQNQRLIGHLQVFSHTSCDLISGFMPNTQLEVIIIKNQALYERIGGPYTNEFGQDWHDNPMRFGVLSKVASLLCDKNNITALDWVPEIVHCNDWQTGLTPYYLHLTQASHVKTILSIHNLAFQGNFHPNWLHTLEMNPDDFKIEGYEFYGHLSFLKAGVYYADELATVSPNYAKEIQTEAFGFGMQGLLQAREHKITGILNGIDTEEWNPETDTHLPYAYNAKKLNNKQLVKSHLQEKMQLPVAADTPLFGIVSRLTHQKGVDIVIETIPELITMGCQIVVLGSGEKAFEAQLLSYAAEFPHQVAVTIGYNEPLSHLVMAGVDIFLMPSRFEPCGLNQLYGLRYGTPPIVSNTGGLADSICHTTDETLANHTATGFVMENVNRLSLLVTIKQVLSIWKNKKSWKEIQTNGMKQEIGWKNSANAYIALYKKVLTD